MNNPNKSLLMLNECVRERKLWKRKREREWRRERGKKWGRVEERERKKEKEKGNG